MNCYACNSSDFDRKAVTVPIRVGEQLVEAKTVQVPVCRACGEYTLDSEVYQRLEQQAAVIVLHDCKAMTGAMLKFARKAVGLTQKELADKLGTAPESISRWEREERPMEAWVKSAMLGVLSEPFLPPFDGMEVRRTG